jgi:hypothetical protein
VLPGLASDSLEHCVRVDGQGCDHVLDPGKLIAPGQVAKPDRALYLLDQLFVRRRSAMRIKPEGDWRRNPSASRMAARLRLRSSQFAQVDVIKHLGYPSPPGLFGRDRKPGTALARVGTLVVPDPRAWIGRRAE